MTPTTLFKTMGLDLNIFSSALKLNTQYMHTIHFNLRLRRAIDMDELMRRFQLGAPSGDDQQGIVGFGFFIRPRSWAVWPDSQPDRGRQPRAWRSMTTRKSIGTCFTPQDGNSLLSSIAASLWFMYPDSYEEKLAPVRPYFFSEI